MTAALPIDSPAGAMDRDQWLRLQASDLIEGLQKWSADLDAREANLNAKLAQHERRDRQARVRQQETEATLNCRQADLDALAAQLSAHARRLAFEISGN